MENFSKLNLKKMLYRAQNYKNEWIEGYPIRDSEGNFYILTYFNNVPDLENEDLIYYKIKKETLSQCTSREDKNNNKIYENDIIKFEFENNFRKVFVIGIVVFKHCYFTTNNIKNLSFWKKNNKYDPTWETVNLLAQHSKDIEIIGNIFFEKNIYEKIEKLIRR